MRQYPKPYWSKSDLKTAYPKGKSTKRFNSPPPKPPFSKVEVEAMMEIIATTFTDSTDRRQQLIDWLLELCKYYHHANQSNNEKFGGMSPKMLEIVRGAWKERLGNSGLTDKYGENMFK